MAFGDLFHADNDNLPSCASSNPLSIGPIAVSVNDLVYALFIEATSRTVTTVTDNLGNTYTALNAGTDAGNITARAYYSRVTVAGTLTTVTFAATSSGNDIIEFAAVFEGPFAASPLDQNPANVTSDITSPFSCPPTGVLVQSAELVVAWGATLITELNPVAPMSNVDSNESGSMGGAIASKVVASTTTTTPSFTAVANPTQAILGTSTFKKLTTITETVPVTQATVTLTGKTITVRTFEKVAVTQATVTAVGKTVTVRELELVVVDKATVTVAGQTVVGFGTGGEFVAVEKATVAFTGKTVTISDVPTVIYVDRALLAFTGKTVAITIKTPVDQAAVTFTGQTVTVRMSAFEHVPKYIIRGRGSRHDIKGRGSRAFLVTR